MHFLINQHYWYLSWLFKIHADMFHVVLGLESLPWPQSSPLQYIRINVAFGELSNNAQHDEFYR